MDELDDLKQLWQEFRPARKEPLFDQAQLTAMLRTRSEGVLARLRRNMILEATFGALVVLVLGAVVVLDLVRGNALLFGAMGVLLLPFFGYYWWTLRLMRSFQTNPGSLRERLRDTVAALESSLRLYTRMNMALIPPALLLGGWLGMNLGAGQSRHPTGQRLGHLVLVLLGALVSILLITALFYPLIRWLVWKTYGVHLQKLKDCLRELEEKEG